MSWKTKSTSSRRVPAAEMMIPGVELITRSCATAGAEVSAVAAACWPLVARYLGHVLEEVDEELAALRHAALRDAGTTTAVHTSRHPLSLSPQGQEEERHTGSSALTRRVSRDAHDAPLLQISVNPKLPSVDNG